MGTQGGFGVKVKFTVGTSLTAVAHVTDVDYPEFEKILYDRTAHDSPGGYQEFGDSGKRKVGSFTAKLEWDAEEATHAAMQAAFDSTGPVAMSIEDPGGTEVISGSVFVQKLGREAKQEDGYFCNVTLQPTGQWAVA